MMVTGGIVQYLVKDQDQIRSSYIRHACIMSAHRAEYAHQLGIYDEGSKLE